MHGAKGYMCKETVEIHNNHSINSKTNGQLNERNPQNQFYFLFSIPIQLRKSGLKCQLSNLNPVEIDKE